MASPIDYTSAFANIPSPQESFMQGVRDSATMQQLQAQRQQQAMALQQAEAARQQQIRMQNDLGALSQNPTSAGIAKFTTRYPHLSEPMKRAFDMLEPAEKQTQLNNWNQVSAAFETNHPEIAIKLMREQATALRNSKNEREAGAAEAMANLAETDPVFAKILTGKMLATISGPEKYAEAMAKLGGEQRAQEQAPADLAKKRAEAAKSGAEAIVAAETIPAMIDKPMQENLSAAAKRRVDDLNVQIGQADSETKRGQLVLERNKFIAEQGKKTQETGAGAQEAMDSANALLDQIRGVSSHPGLEAGTGTLSGIRSFFNSSKGNDFRKAVEGLKAPVFLNELGKLKAAGVTLGAVTEAEGKKLEQRIANLDTDQSTPAFKNQVGVLLRDTEKFIEKVKASGKLPTKGGAFVMDHPKLGKITEGDINRMITQNPGATRAQVMEYLRTVQAGGASGDY